MQPAQLSSMGSMFVIFGTRNPEKLKTEVGNLTAITTTHTCHALMLFPLFCKNHLLQKWK